MINETILHLPPTDFGGTRLEKFEQELYGSDGIWNPEFRYSKSLRKIFSKVIQYDYAKKQVELGILRSNSELIQVVRSEHPKYLFWPSMSYEIQETTFQTIRREGSFVIGWFFDDECRFDEYSRWWIPYLDYILTVDKHSVKKYQELGATAMHLLVIPNPEVCRRLEIEKRYNVSFVGAKIVDRGSIVDQLKAKGVQVQTFGRGWSKGPVSLHELVNIYNASKINLCFVKSYGVTTRPQMKSKIFDICMCGGFLLCEYIPGIEDYFEIDKEIVCFRDIDEAMDKIRYYLSHETERQAIAQAGWEKSKREHNQTAQLLKIFEEIESDTRSGKQRIIGKPGHLDMLQQIRRLPSLYHLRWARVLMREGFAQKRWQEELDLALFYNPRNIEVHLLTLIGHLPAFIRPALIRLWNALGGLKRTLRAHLAGISVLREINQRLSRRVML